MAEKTLVVSQNISGNNLLGGGGKSKRICGDLLVVTSDFVPQLDFNIREDFILVNFSLLFVLYFTFFPENHLGSSPCNCFDCNWFI